jgi:hypothetical protein
MAAGVCGVLKMNLSSSAAATRNHYKKRDSYTSNRHLPSSATPTTTALKIHLRLSPFCLLVALRFGADSKALPLILMAKSLDHYAYIAARILV